MGHTAASLKAEKFDVGLLAAVPGSWGPGLGARGSTFAFWFMMQYGHGAPRRSRPEQAGARTQIQHNISAAHYPPPLHSTTRGQHPTSRNQCHSGHKCRFINSLHIVESRFRGSQQCSHPVVVVWGIACSNLCTSQARRYLELQVRVQEGVDDGIPPLLPLNARAGRQCT